MIAMTMLGAPAGAWLPQGSRQASFRGWGRLAKVRARETRQDEL